jgi:FkbM family methyltransferase
MEIHGKIDAGGAAFDAIQLARRTVKALLPASVRALLPPVVRNAPLVVKAWPVFESPLAVVHHYLNRSVPPAGCIRLRSGGELTLSGHALDTTVAFQVFCDEVYPVDHDTTIVDIGANIGMFSLYAAFRGARKVYAFEPNGEAYRCMLHNIERNGLQGRIVPCQRAVTSRADEIVTIAKAASPQNRIGAASAPDDEHELVSAISLDEIVRRNDLSRIDLLKMDCEGSEYDILGGTSASTFSRIGRLILEYHHGREREIENDLRRHGFRLQKEAAENERMGMMWFGRA